MIITHTIVYAFSIKEDYEAWQTFLETKGDDWIEHINSTTAQYVMSRSWIREKGNEDAEWLDNAPELESSYER